MPSSEGPTLSVIIPVYNGGQSFRICLASLTALLPSPHEIIVVDDCSADGSGQVAAESSARAVRTLARSGPAQARNLGARLASGDVLFFVDADVALACDAIALLTAVFRQEPDVAAVFGSYDDAPAAPNFLSQYKNLLHHYVHQNAREDASTFWAGCGAVRRDVFLGLGGFAERYREPSVEDIELGCRLKHAGYSIRLLKTLQAKHLKRWSALSLLRSDIMQRALPWSELILRDGRFVDDLNTGRSGRLSVALACGTVGCMAAALLALGRSGAATALASATAALGVLSVLLNWQLYRFFGRQRGLRFALCAVPWYWLYHLYSGLAFAIAAVRHVVRSVRQRDAGSTTGTEKTTKESISTP
jgi:GT2 family glycosyltransferase